MFTKTNNNNFLLDLKQSVTSLDSVVKLDSATTALVVIDMQVDYCSPEGVFSQQMGYDVSPNEEIVEPLSLFASKFRAAGSPVVFTRMIEIPEFMPRNLATKINSFSEPAYLCDPATRGFDFFGIKPEASDFQIIKNTYNSFLSTDSHAILASKDIKTELLREILKQNRVKSIVFTGVLTSRCVLTTLLGAIDRAYNCVVPFDLVSMPAGKLQIRHYSALAEMATMYADVTHSDKICLIN